MSAGSTAVADFAARSAAAANVLTHHNDDQGTGANRHETILTTNTVNVDRVCKLYEWTIVPTRALRSPGIRRSRTAKHQSTQGLPG